MLAIQLLLLQIWLHNPLIAFNEGRRVWMKANPWIALKALHEAWITAEYSGVYLVDNRAT